MAALGTGEKMSKVIKLVNISIPIEELLRRAVRNARPRDGKRVRWGCVGGLFSLGSNSAIALCKKYDINPHEMIGEESN